MSNSLLFNQFICLLWKGRPWHLGFSMLPEPAGFLCDFRGNRGLDVCLVFQYISIFIF